MKVIDPGHIYELDTLDGDFRQIVRFVKRFRGALNHSGTVNQELLRVQLMCLRATSALAELTGLPITPLVK